MTDPLVIRLPFTPVLALSPNGRVSRWERPRFVRAHKDQARLATWSVLNEPDVEARWVLEPGPIRISYAVRWERKRKDWDQDNMIAALKPAVDGICDALGIDDKRLRLAGIDQAKDDEGIGYTEVRLWREDG